MSAERVIAARLRLRECTTVTVAFPFLFFCMSSRASGLPTIMLRPRTTTCAPSITIFVSVSNRCTPSGVHGTKPLGSSSTSFATFSGWNPSTSLRGSNALTMAASSMCSGVGDCASIDQFRHFVCHFECSCNPVANPKGGSRDPSTSLRFAQDDKESAHFNQRHHGVLQAHSFRFKLFRCGSHCDTIRPIDQHSYLGKRAWHDEPVPTSQPPTVRIFEIHGYHRRPRFLRQKDYPRTEFVSWTAWTVGSDHHIATGHEDPCEVEKCARAQPRAGAANHIVAKTLNNVGNQIAIAAGTDQGGAMTLRKKTTQDEWENQ